MTALVGCSSQAPAAPSAAATLSERLDALDGAAAALQSSKDLATAHRQAETVRNLIVGSRGPAYGDGDGDGTIEGEAAAGILPGLDGSAGLLDAEHPLNSCVERDALGGSWADASGRWAEAQDALARWKPGNNTFPSLESHAQRSFGWSSLALASDSLSAAHEYSGHLMLHLDVVRRSVESCQG